MSIADVLLINMWTQDVGRHTASNYALLKIILEVNLRIFDSHQAKKMLFVLRDFSPESNKEHIMGMIRTDISNIWAEIHKPEKFKEKTADDFFDLEFAFLPHKIYAPT